MSSSDWELAFIWYSTKVYLNLTWPPDHHLTFPWPLRNLNCQLTAQKKLSGGRWAVGSLVLMLHFTYDIWRFNVFNTFLFAEYIWYSVFCLQQHWPEAVWEHPQLPSWSCLLVSGPCGGPPPAPQPGPWGTGSLLSWSCSPAVTWFSVVTNYLNFCIQ